MSPLPNLYQQRFIPRSDPRFTTTKTGRRVEELGLGFDVQGRDDTDDAGKGRDDTVLAAYLLESGAA
ncbi:hypothetical protein AKJ16_DCAP03840 [Drosera capensis]